MLAPVKVAVCMKEVPEAAAPKRIDPQTLRLDRSGDGALNDFDTHALE
jgi:electron transfer flavoprotein beta subunit